MIIIVSSAAEKMACNYWKATKDLLLAIASGPAQGDVSSMLGQRQAALAQH